MTDNEDSTKITPPDKFIITGLITSEDFQKCRYAVQKLNKSFPKEFDFPDIRPMLDVEWNEFITKYQRKLGNGLWSIKNNVAVFKNGEFLGDFDDLFEFIWKKRKFLFHEDWYALACKHLIEYLEEKIDNFRQLVYLTIAINNQVKGTLLFELFNDIVPLASENFLNRCKNNVNGYEGTPIHRIVKNSWIQGGGYDLTPCKIPCENYVVPHDRRGVLSMCNNGPHKDNSTQFYVTHCSTPWMDYKYVAFGQLLQGDDVLRAIEEVPTFYQAPKYNVTIVKCGEFKTRYQADPLDLIFSVCDIEKWQEAQGQDILAYIKKYHETMAPEGQDSPLPEPPKPIVSTDSIFFAKKLKDGSYSLNTDLVSYGPFFHLPDFVVDNNDEGVEDYNTCEPSFSVLRYNNKLYDDNLSPNSSDLTL